MLAAADQASALETPRHPALRIADFPGKGRGLIVAAALPERTLLEAAPVIPLRPDELGERHGLYAYPFHWPEPPYVEAIALGVVSLLNHSETPNADFDLDIENRLIRLYTRRAVSAGEELTIDYGIPLWFDVAPT